MLRLGTLHLLRGVQLTAKPTMARSLDAVAARPSMLSTIYNTSVRNFASKKPKAIKPVMQHTSSPLGVAADGAAADGALKKVAAPSAFPSQQFKTYKPTTPGKRWLKRVPRDHLYKGKAVRNLTVAKRSTGGRNNHGRITIRHRGGGHKRRIRIIDWHRNETGVQKVMRLEHDPGRSAWIALLRHEETGQLSYIVAPHGVKAGDKVSSYRNSEDATAALSPDASSGIDAITRTVNIEKGNCMPVKMIPVGTIIHNIGLRRNGPAIIARSAGTYAQLIQTGETGYAQVRLSSGEVRRVPVDVCATIGSVSNPDHQHEMLGKAGRSRWLGIRPTVRGVAQNATDHPHGGGRGKSKGNKDPRSPWGVLAKGGKTRKSPNPFVVKPRPRR
ncbi:mitochondrial 54S ribosomal protein rml2 [Umbelopsis nana]